MKNGVFTIFFVVLSIGLNAQTDHIAVQDVKLENGATITNYNNGICKDKVFENTRFEMVSNPCDSLTDLRDGNKYKTVKIGNQVWMAENLRYLPEVVRRKTGDIYLKDFEFFYVYGFNDTTVSKAKATRNYQTYGVLYNWKAANTSCPEGWHLPSDAEWQQLSDFLGGDNVAGGKLKEIGVTLWKKPNIGAIDSFGFKARPGGGRHYDKRFYFIGRYGYWWSSTEDGPNTAWARYMWDQASKMHRNNGRKDMGFSVRCVKD
ncbi:MAG TPA: fibrobacter succinogenes major paralogous domain-containing protein [Bacteroidales bacterium]|nr:fibrobacter succinogenes major paralogous domain-containing protein [Bacteroidales bacterium]